MYLNCHTYYSLRYGTLPVEHLVEKAAMHGIHSLVLTDINNTMGMMDFIMSCNEKNIKPIAGIEFRDHENHLLYIGIARNNEGFRELNEFLTYHNLNHEPLPPDAPVFSNVFIIYPFGKKSHKQLGINEFTGIKTSDLNRLITSGYRKDQSKLVSLHPVTYDTPDDYTLHRHLVAIDNNTLLSKLNPSQLASPQEKLVAPDLLRIAYEDFPKIMKNTEQLIDECSIAFDFNTVKNKKTFTGSRYDDKQLLEKLALDGMTYRYGKSNKEALRRIRHELEIIDNLGFSAYFLITWDIIRYSLTRGFYHVGRGSGANSIVAYCLKITDVDPIELDLYFERFINPKRTSPPDFDIDYSWKDRDEVQDYIFKRYGHKHTALLGATTTFKDRSIVRELGKVYGLPKKEIDDLVDHPANAMNKSEISEQIFRIGSLIEDFPNNRSIHAGGILISEEPITCYTALDMPPKGFQTTQWDMYVAGMIGFEKLDILSQRGIGHINESVEIILKNKGEKIDVHQVATFKKDPEINRRLFHGETNGCFYIESPAMRGLLKKLQCSDYIRLVAASSIIRPGVAQSGMMKEYIYRFHNPDKFKYLHPVMEDQLRETYGVMVYQEDVIKICHHFAGLDLSDADILRRAMAGRARSKNEFQRIQDKFFSNCQERGHPESVYKEVWRQVASFAGYSFSKAHSASYAVESYQSLFIKTYYPQEFMVAVINNFGGFFRTWVYFNEARKSGANIHLTCVNKSTFMTCIYGSDIYVGFVHIMNLESTLANKIVEEREQNGEYLSLANFIDRLQPGIEQVTILIRLDAFRFTDKTKKQLLWDAHMMLGKKTEPQLMKPMFETLAKEFVLPPLEQTALEDAYDEIELIGFPITMTHFDMLETNFRGSVFANDLMNCIGKEIKILGNLVCIKNVHTVKREWMHFGCFFDVQGNFFDTVHFPNTLKTYPFKGYGVYLVLGKVVEEFGFPTIEVKKMAKMPFKKDPRY